MLKEISLKTWLDNLSKGLYAAKDCDTMVQAGWYDWFCTDRSLHGRMMKMVPMIKRVCKSSKINLETSYIFFKNNCPCFGKLYDDFRICDIKTGNVIFTITPASGHDKNFGEASVWGRENDFKKALVEGTKEDIYKFFNV